MKTLTSPQLHKRLAELPRPLLLHVLPDEHFAACHIAGAVNACIYETSFLDSVRELAPDPTTPLIVYGAGLPSLDSATAATKLTTAGYSNVADFPGGLREWQAAGLPVEGHGRLPAPVVPDGDFRMDSDGSVIRWTGQNLFNHHEGTLKLAGGYVQLMQGLPNEGEFTLDMNSMVCTDLDDHTWNTMLINHLRSEDFFQVADHPTAHFVITGAKPIADVTTGVPNYHVTGLLTLRGITRELTFPVIIAAADSDHLTAQAHVTIDRTQFGSCYGSGKFFAYLGKHVVNDYIQLHLKIHALRA